MLGDRRHDDKVFVPGPGRIFVFGSNEEGGSAICSEDCMDTHESFVHNMGKDD